MTSYAYFWTSTTHREFAINSARGNKAVYIAFGKAWGRIQNNEANKNNSCDSSGDDCSWKDVHAPGAQRSDPKEGDPKSWKCGHGPQNDYISIYNYVRCVRRTDKDTAEELKADFSANVQHVKTDDPIQFQDRSSGTPVFWHWKFESGTPSEYVGQLPPPIIWKNSGIYDVSLIISNSDGSISEVETKYDFITVAFRNSGEINNAGLEQGNAYWVGSGSFQITRDEPHTGIFCMEIWNQGSQYSQVVTGLSPNTTYKLSAFGKGVGTKLIASGYNGDEVVDLRY